MIGTPLGLGAWSASWWWRCDLRLEPEHIIVGSVCSRRRLTWASIERLDLRPAERRTVALTLFAWWRDQATVRRRDGSVARVRAIQPYHGGPLIDYHTTFQSRKADEIVAELNHLRDNLSPV